MSQITFRRVLQDAIGAWLIELKREMLVCDFPSLQAEWAFLFPAPFRERA